MHLLATFHFFEQKSCNKMQSYEQILLKLLETTDSRPRDIWCGDVEES